MRWEKYGSERIIFFVVTLLLTKLIQKVYCLTQYGEKSQNSHLEINCFFSCMSSNKTIHNVLLILTCHVINHKILMMLGADYESQSYRVLGSSLIGHLI